MEIVETAYQLCPNLQKLYWDKFFTILYPKIKKFFIENELEITQSNIADFDAYINQYSHTYDGQWAPHWYVNPQCLCPRKLDMDTFYATFHNDNIVLLSATPMKYNDPNYILCEYDHNAVWDEIIELQKITERDITSYHGIGISNLCCRYIYYLPITLFKNNFDDDDPFIKEILMRKLLAI